MKYNKQLKRVNYTKKKKRY
ncbi:hypothetical protein PFNF54_05834 [Plasmodium falciparum NF54]|uniref:Uncharacterized protein n=1 Tax=Plasmodium falciparum (isolate NF54) TaxID=5843 RepID=W7JW86_PLAFO|nr:hypothetical protein PFNF54_05834 [Plasmodium falciparum NF54]